jgi:tryptophan synthase alpha chain
VLEKARRMVEGGADVVELGVPFSDPLADGPVIQAAATAALREGATFEAVLGVCEAIAGRVPVVPMVYANAVLARGPAEFAAALAAAGAAGAIVPDLPPEEGGEVAARLAEVGLPWSPSSPRPRPRSAAARSAGAPRASSTSFPTPASPASATSCRPGSRT